MFENINKKVIERDLETMTYDTTVFEFEDAKTTQTFYKKHMKYKDLVSSIARKGSKIIFVDSRDFDKTEVTMHDIIAAKACVYSMM